MDFARVKSGLKRAGVIVGKGMREHELLAAEQAYDFVFPPDLREWLGHMLPRSDRFPNWRRLDCPEIRDRLSVPLDDIWANGNFWWPADYGERPTSKQALRDRIPVLIPVYGHRYLPAFPCVSGNPVFSFWSGSDIIYYGSDLENYFENEFREQLSKNPITGEEEGLSWGLLQDASRPVPYWTELILQIDLWQEEGQRRWKESGRA